MPSERSERGVAARWAAFETWRKIMIGGALLLLADALLNATLKTSWPSWAGTAFMVAGYVLLALGFARRMRERREAAEVKRQRERLKG